MHINPKPSNVFHFILLLFLCNPLQNFLIAQQHNWIVSNNGLSNIYINCLTALSNNLIFAGTNDGIFYSSDAGESWVKRSSGINYMIITSIHANRSNILFAGTEKRNGQNDLHAQNVVSIDSGKSWKVINIGYPDYEFQSIASKGDSDIFASIHYVDYYDQRAKRYIIHSKDNGQSWGKIQINNLQDVDAIWVHNSLILACGLISSGSNNFPTSNLLRSTDLGQTWQYLTIDIPNVDITSFCLDSLGVIYASTNYDGIFCSNDLGQTWELASNDLTDKVINCTIVGVDNYIYAGSWSKGLFYSSNQGNTWNVDTNGMGNLEVTSIIQFSSSKFIVGTYGDGIFISTIRTNISENLSQGKLDYVLLTNYPNPFNPSTTIKYSIPQIGRVKISVWNLLGQKVKVLVNKVQSSGSHQVKWHPKNIASGIYICTLISNGYLISKKIIYIK